MILTLDKACGGIHAHRKFRKENPGCLEDYIKTT